MFGRAVGRLPRLITAARCERSLVCRPIWLVAESFLFNHPLLNTSGGTTRQASSSSSTRWKSRQSRDTFAKEAKTAGLKSRAAFKLLEINDKYRIFKRGDTVVDLGYAPGSWSQVAISKTQPGGRVVGIDVIPAQPPKGVSTIQGNFLSPEIREEVRNFVQDPARGRARSTGQLSRTWDDEDGLTEDELELESRGVLGRERLQDEETATPVMVDDEGGEKAGFTQKELDRVEGRVVNVVLSDMSEPWPLTTSRWIKSVSNPFHRMMNTSGMAFRDHAGSMVSCSQLEKTTGVVLRIDSCRTYAMRP